MDRKEAFRNAAQTLATAAVVPDYKFPRDSLAIYGADGPGGLRALLGGFVDVTNALESELPSGDEPDGRPTEVFKSGDEISAINEWIAYGRIILTALGKDPHTHINRVLGRHVYDRPV